MRRARAECGYVAASIFVNPTQFGPTEDLARYPRDLPRDEALCRREGVDLLFVPAASEMYPPGFQTSVRVAEVSGPLCGTFRPGHFEGVATVVLKLFHVVGPDRAYFGEKDYQQLQVIRRMVRDLDLDVEVVGVPTVREDDGLAMSSRNAYLSPEERGRALSLSRALAAAEGMAAGGERDAGKILEKVRAVLAEGDVRVEYAELRDPDTLGPLAKIEGRAVLALAGFVGKTRLIDNRVIEGKG
jgi:pantoate--beta-alanine ligase